MQFTAFNFDFESGHCSNESDRGIRVEIGISNLEIRICNCGICRFQLRRILSGPRLKLRAPDSDAKMQVILPERVHNAANERAKK